MKLFSRRCPMCFSLSHSPISKVREYTGLEEAPTVVECDDCGFVFLNPVMTEESYRDFYNRDEQKRFAASLTKQTEREYQAKISRDDNYRAKLVRSIINPYDSLLDVGTGFSNFVGLIDGAVGIDVSEPRVKSAQERGLDVRLCNVFDWDVNDKKDAVTLFHVLEHIVDPYPFLGQIREILSDYGQLIIEVPNLDDALVKLESYKNFYYQNAHCSYFTPRTLKKLLRDCDFELEYEKKLQRYSLDNHANWFFKGRPGKIEGLGFLNKPYSSLMKLAGSYDTIFMVFKRGKR